MSKMTKADRAELKSLLTRAAHQRWWTRCLMSGKEPE